MFFSSVRLGFGLAWLGSVRPGLASQAAPKKKKTAEPAGVLSIDFSVQLGFGLAWLGSVWLGEPSRTEEKYKTAEPEPGRKSPFFSSVRLGLAEPSRTQENKNKNTAEPAVKFFS